MIESNVIQDGADCTLRLREARLDGVLQAAYLYDGDGGMVQRVAAGTTTLYLGNLVEIELGAEQPLWRYYYYFGADRIAVREAGVLSYLFGDHLGSTTITANPEGTLQSEMRYKPWGEVRYSNGIVPTDYLYTGQRDAPEAGLYYYNARWYDSSLGRFAQADTLVPETGSPTGWDRYAYVNNDPVKYKDPSGHCVWDGCVIETIVAGAIISITVDWVVTTQIEHKEYTWQRAAVAAGTGALSGGIGAGVIAPIAAATGSAIASLLGVAAIDASAVAAGAELVTGITLAAVTNISVSSAQRTAKQSLNGIDVSIETYKSNLRENWVSDALFGAIGYGLGSTISKGISSTFPIRPPDGLIPGWNNNSGQRIIIGSMQAGGQALTNSTLLDFLFKPVPTQPQLYKSVQKPINWF